MKEIASFRKCTLRVGSMHGFPVCLVNNMRFDRCAVVQSGDDENHFFIGVVAPLSMDGTHLNGFKIEHTFPNVDVKVYNYANKGVREWFSKQ